jgi:RNA polymerase sigma factor (sigma-70 family)
MLEELGDDSGLLSLRMRLVYLAVRRGLRAADAEDVVQNTLAAYLEVRDRYGEEENHAAILHGILHNKCLEFFDRHRREKQGLARCASRPDAVRANPMLSPEGMGASPATLEEVIHREQGERILAALSDLPAGMREIIHQLAEIGRKGVVAVSGENKNTVDTRIHAARQKLKTLLARHGVTI